jgi:hypothetical protein
MKKVFLYVILFSLVLTANSFAVGLVRYGTISFLGHNMPLYQVTNPQVGCPDAVYPIPGHHIVATLNSGEVDDILPILDKLAFYYVGDFKSCYVIALKNWIVKRAAIGANGSFVIKLTSPDGQSYIENSYRGACYGCILDSIIQNVPNWYNTHKEIVRDFYGKDPDVTNIHPYVGRVIVNTVTSTGVHLLVGAYITKSGYMESKIITYSADTNVPPNGLYHETDIVMPLAYRPLVARLTYLTALYQLGQIQFASY